MARSVLGALRARAPAVAVLEDAHWADPATVDVLRLLARRVEDAGIVVIVTYRDDELAVNPALACWSATSSPVPRPGAWRSRRCHTPPCAAWPARPTSTPTGCGA